MRMLRGTKRNTGRQSHGAAVENQYGMKQAAVLRHHRLENARRRQPGDCSQANTADCRTVCRAC